MQGINRVTSPAQRLRRLSGLLEMIPVLPRVSKRIDIQLDSLGQINRKEKEILMMEVHQPIFGVISIYINSKEVFPRSDQVLFCNETTSWQMLQAFLYRCVKSHKKELYCLVRPEQLSLENQDKVTNLLQMLVKEEMDVVDFRIAIVTTDSRSYVSNFFRL